jgi:hypothetical protein
VYQSTGRNESLDPRTDRPLEGDAPEWRSTPAASEGLTGKTQEGRDTLDTRGYKLALIVEDIEEGESGPVDNDGSEDEGTVAGAGEAERGELVP